MSNHNDETLKPEDEHVQKAVGWAARDESGVLSPFHFSRRSTGEEDVNIKIYYCGICHTDYEYATNGWGISQYPLVPGYMYDTHTMFSGAVRDAANLIKEDDVEALTEEEVHEEELLKDTPVSDINDNDQAEDNIEEEVATDMETRQLRTNRNQRPSRFGEFSVDWSG